MPEKIILDTDMFGDYDDAGALAVLHDYANRGMAEILATVSCTAGPRNRSVAVCEIINAFHGRADIPVGSTKAPTAVGRETVGETKNSRYGYGVCEKYAHWVKHMEAEEAEDAVTVYRRVLSAAPDGSVTIVTIGFLTNLAGLLRSKGDEHSPLDGPALVRAKVKKWVAMACAYPVGKECNSMWDPVSSRIVLDEWPTPAIFTDFTYGRTVFTGRRLADSGLRDVPVVDIYRNCLVPVDQLTKNEQGEWSWDTPEGHPSWDHTAILIAVEGTEPFFGLERGRYAMVGDDGTNDWTPDPAGPHVRVTEKMPRAQIAERLEDAMLRSAGA